MFIAHDIAFQIFYDRTSTIKDEALKTYGEPVGLAIAAVKVAAVLREIATQREEGVL